MRWGVVDGPVTLGFAFASNLGLEFWPGIKKKLFRNK